ncbi:MAG: preprotein translocase subunit SecG [Nitrospirota bacterium]
MTTLLVMVHIVMSIVLILIVLLQAGKGADVGAAFGGGSSHTVFGSRGAGTFLSRLTAAAAIIFMLTSLSLAYLSRERTASSVVDTMKQKGSQTAPAEKPAQQPSAAPEGQPEGQKK